jgi:predicted transposase/invertase (TIGR01784 family)
MRRRSSSLVNIKANPKIDLVFRKLFGSETNKDLLISLINSVVSPTYHLVDVIIKNPFNLADYMPFKESILDIKAVDQNGIWYDVEMQLTPHVLYGKRALFYLSKVYTEQLERASDYSSLNTTIGIHFLDFEYFKDERIVRRFVFKDSETDEAPEELSSLQLYFVEMGKFDKEWSEVRSALDRWIAFLNRAVELNRLELPAQLKMDPVIVSAAEELESFGLNSKEREIYESEVKAFMVDQIQLRTAKEEGLQQGIQEGIQQGMQEGVQQGMQSVLLRQMSLRLGDVPSTIADRVNGLRIEDLDDLSADRLELNSYSEIEHWLTQH